MLQMVGVDADVDGDTLRILPPAPPAMALYGDTMDEPPPIVVASEDDVTALAPATGENGAILTYRGLSYRILSITNDEDGFVSILLGPH